MKDKEIIERLKKALEGCVLENQELREKIVELENIRDLIKRR